MLWVPTVPHLYFGLLTAPMAGLDICNMMCRAGGSGLEQAIVGADEAMPPEGLPVASKRAGGESRRLGLKRKAGEITRFAAEDFALPSACTASARYVADFLSIVGNVSFSHKDLKLSKYSTRINFFQVFYK
jgi:hypothetical protein